MTIPQPPTPPVPVSTSSQLLKVLGGWIAWGEQHLLPWGINAWPKWSNEGLGGILELIVCLLPALHWGWWFWVAYPLYTALSYGYEKYVDTYAKIPAAPAWGDFFWRQIGATVVYGVLIWLR
jgi:hypothetical protein